MNGTENITAEYIVCELLVPAALLWVALVHGYCVMVIGTLGNALALWCAATCAKTGGPSVLISTMFLCNLVMCLVGESMWAELLAVQLTCDPDRIFMTVWKIMVVIINILQQVDVTTIAAIAVVRAVAVWAPHRPKLGIRGAVVLLVVTCIYAILVPLVVLCVWEDWLEVDPWVIPVIEFVTETLPVLITIAACILMIFAIQRNKRRLVTFQQQPRVTVTMDQATRAMLAVFISNLLFWLPSSIYFLLATPTLYLDVIFFSIHSTGFLADPLVYMWLSNDYRDKIMSCMTHGIQYMSRLVHQKGHDASPDRQELQAETNL